MGEMVVAGEGTRAAYATIGFENNIVSNGSISIPLKQRAKTPFLLDSFFRHIAQNDIHVTVLTLKRGSSITYYRALLGVPWVLSDQYIASFRDYLDGTIYIA